jgi:PqqD family protein of HPr-rel-A system
VRRARAPGVRVEPVGDGWAAFSALSGETLLLNDEAAAILEVLSAHEALDAQAVCAALARDSGLAPQEIDARIRDTWALLASTGLVVDLPLPPPP